MLGQAIRMILPGFLFAELYTVLSLTRFPRIIMLAFIPAVLCAFALTRTRGEDREQSPWWRLTGLVFGALLHLLFFLLLKQPIIGYFWR
jgi:hypothetical protein